MSLNQSAINLLDQLEEVISQLSDEHYGQSLEILSGASIGQHVRHLLEFFICYMDAEASGVICYDRRKRDPFIERDTKLAVDVMYALRRFLSETLPDQPIQLVAGYETESNDSTSLSSSRFRELAYNIEHAIHHMALIKVGVKSIHQEVTLPDHFGVAGSTVRYYREKKS